MRRLSIIAVLVLLALPLGAIHAIVPPKVIDPPHPKYPEAALRQMAQGTVVLSAIIDEHGTVQDVRIVQGLRDHGYGLEGAAIDALRNARYEPAKHDGKPVPVKFTMTFIFKRP